MKSIPTINNNCTLCGECINICPKNHLFKNENTIEVKVDVCMLCSHCYSVCKYDAISFDPAALKKISFKSIKHKESEEIIDHDSLINTFRTRRSIRKYKEDPVEKEILLDLVEFGTTAPSGSNCQLWEFTVLDTREKVFTLGKTIENFFIKINKLARNPFVRYLTSPFNKGALVKYYNNNYSTVEMGLKEAQTGKDLLFHGAPALIVIHGTTDGSTPSEDAQYAAYNISLMAHTLNLGTCYIGYAVEAINRDEKTKKFLNIPKNNRVFSVIILGYYDNKFTQLAMRKPYKVEIL